MEITILHVRTPIAVAVLHLVGELNGSDDQSLVQEVRRQVGADIHNIILDFRLVTCTSEAGLAVLDSAAAAFGGSGSADGFHPNIKLVNLPLDVHALFEQSGLASRFQVCTDLQQALKSFNLE